MQNSKNKLACIILAVLISLSGLFSECSQAASLFSSAPMENASSNIKSVQASFTDTQVCTAEMLGIRSIGTITQLSGRYIYQKKVFQTSLDYFFSTILIPQGGIRSAGTKETLFSGPCSYGQITNYIHNSDGKKRI